MRKNVVIGVLLIVGACLLTGHAWAIDDWLMEIDNTNAGLVGPWVFTTNNLADAAGNFYGVNYAYVACTGNPNAFNASALFVAPTTLDNGGRYNVYINWTQSLNRSTAAPWQIWDRNPSLAGAVLRAQGVVNEETNGGEWVLVASLTLTEGQRPAVRLMNNCANEGNGAFVIADAVRFVKQQIDLTDVLEPFPGIDFAQASSRDIATELADCTAANWTRLTNFTLAPPVSGLVHVTANGIAALRTAGRFVRVCISDTNVGGELSCQSWRPIIETDSVGGAADWWGERRYALNNVYSVVGSTTFYLVACREAGATGRLFWDDFVGTYFRRQY